MVVAAVTELAPRSYAHALRIVFKHTHTVWEGDYAVSILLMREDKFLFSFLFCR
jgi:hypothetical protein